MIRHLPTSLAALAILFALAAVPIADPRPAAAASLVATVNDEPITDVDLERRTRLLRTLKRTATPDAALEAIIADRLRLRELKKYGLNPGINERNNGIGRIASQMKIPPPALMQSLQGAGLQEKDFDDFFKAEGSWLMLARGLNKGLEVSEREVRAEIERRGTSAIPSEYLMRQVILIVPISANPAQWQARAREAEQLRTRFNDCQSGVSVVRATPETVIKEQFSRAGNSLPDELRNLLDRTPIGKLTPPQRGSTGIEMIALCDKRALRDDAVVGEDIRNELLARKLETSAARMYSDLRARAVIVRRQ
jgi:peptidyl-prolyl cis-trans isomerase SurA